MFAFCTGCNILKRGTAILWIVMHILMMRCTPVTWSGFARGRAISSKGNRAGKVIGTIFAA